MNTCRCALVLVALAFVGCGDEAPDVPDPVKIGLITAFTGRDESQGQAEEAAVRLAIQQVMSAGGLMGRDIELVKGDDHYDPDAAKSETKRLIEKENVAAIIGPVGSAVTLASLEVSVPAKVPSISCCATNDDLDTAFGQKARDRYFFRLLPPDRFQVPVLARAARECHMCKSLAVFHRNDSYGNPFAATLAKTYNGDGEKVAYEVAYDPNQDDYFDEVEAAAATDADCVVLIGYSRDAAHIRRDWDSNAGRDVKWLGSEGILAEAFVMMLAKPALAEGIIVTSPVFEPVTPESDAFKTYYQASTGNMPQAYNAQIYDSAALLLLAIASAGSVDGTKIRDALFEVSTAQAGDVTSGPGLLSDALAALAKGRGVNYQGASGPVDFGDFGNIAPEYDTYRFKAEGGYERIGRVRSGHPFPCE
jgi:ABC-type branched-subunit amino acid transport system substrate-binding protein